MDLKRLLIIGFVWPEPNSSAAGSRMMQLIDLFQKNNFQITFASTAADSAFMSDLNSIGVSRKHILLNDSGFDDFVKEMNPEIVLFDRFMTEEQFGWRVAENCPEALRILDTEDLHCLRDARKKAVKGQYDFAISDLFSDVAKREIASIWRSDFSLMISEAEMDLLRNVFKVSEQQLYYLPFLLEPIDKKVVDSWPGFYDRKDFAFIGNFHHEPNRDAMVFLKNAIWPDIKKYIPEANMKVYGAYMPQQILELHNPSEGFYIMNRAENARQVIRNSRVVLAPLRFGAGIKGKLSEAMFCGTPSVTTIIGAEGMAGNFEWNGVVMDDVKSFVEAAIQLYNDEAIWKRARENGISLYNNRFSKQDFETAFSDYVLEFKNDLVSKRLNNFTGAMLMHHSLLSTKYMSRWIEEKNTK